MLRLLLTRPLHVWSIVICFASHEILQTVTLKLVYDMFLSHGDSLSVYRHVHFSSQEREEQNIVCQRDNKACFGFFFLQRIMASVKLLPKHCTKVGPNCSTEFCWRILVWILESEPSSFRLVSLSSMKFWLIHSPNGWILFFFQPACFACDGPFEGDVDETFFHFYIKKNKISKIYAE